MRCCWTSKLGPFLIGAAWGLVGLALGCERGVPPKPAPSPVAVATVPIAVTAMVEPVEAPPSPCAESQARLTDALRYQTAGRLMAGLRALQAIATDCQTIESDLLEAEMALALGDLPRARQAAQRHAALSADLLQRLDASQAIIDQRRQRQDTARYQSEVGRAHGLRVEGRCEQALRVAEQAVDLRSEAGEALFEQSQAAHCLGRSEQANLLASRAFFEFGAEQAVTWEPAVRLGGLRPGPSEDLVAWAGSTELLVASGRNVDTWTLGTSGDSMVRDAFDSLAGTRTVAGLTKDGRYGVTLDDEQGLSVFDIRNARILWRDKGSAAFWRKEGEPVLLDPAPGKGNELVVYTQAGKLRRFDARTGRRSGTASIPAPWRARPVLSVSSARDADFIVLTHGSPHGGEAASEILHFPSAAPYYRKAPCTKTSTAEACLYRLPGRVLDKRHLAIKSSPDATEQLFDVKTRRLEGEVPHPEASPRQLESSAQDSKGRLFLLWHLFDREQRDANTALEQLGRVNRRWSVVVATPDPDGTFQGEHRTLPETRLAISRLVVSPDDHLLAGYGEAGVVIWNLVTGKLIREIPVVPSVASSGCIDSATSHMALEVGGELLLVDWVNRTARSLSFLDAHQLIEWRADPKTGYLVCDSQGLTRIATVKNGQRTAWRWDWSGQVTSEPTAYVPGSTPERREMLERNRQFGSADRRFESDGRATCEAEICTPLALGLGPKDRLDDLAYVLSGQLLIALWGPRAILLSPDGRRVLGSVEHAGDAGWYLAGISSTAEVPTLHRRFEPGPPSRARLERLAGSSDEFFWCRIGTALYPWSLCGDWFEDPRLQSGLLAVAQSAPPVPLADGIAPSQPPAQGSMPPAQSPAFP